MIIKYDDLKVDLREIEAISAIKHHKIDTRIMGIGEVYEYYSYSLYSKSGLVYKRTCEEDREIPYFKTFYENVVDAWETLNED